ncbi:MAG: YebC/PmpR family DNA-binding transcriptional regulator [Alphaproteobacteria bacterium]
MAGHSQFKNIMYRKGAQDKRRARLFARLTREIMAAAALGSVEGNSRLRSAIQAARTANMPKDNIERALKRASERANKTAFEEMRYEGYGPGGVALLVETLTDNRNRTGADLRALFSKSGGNLGETNSVSFLFERVARIEIPQEVVNEARLLELALEVNAHDCKQEENQHIIIANAEALAQVRDALADKLNRDISAHIAWQPKMRQEVSAREVAQDLMELLAALEDNEDVHRIYTNFEMPDTLLEALAVEVK